MTSSRFLATPTSRQHNSSSSWHGAHTLRRRQERTWSTAHGSTAPWLASNTHDPPNPILFPYPHPPPFRPTGLTLSQPPGGVRPPEEQPWATDREAGSIP